ncbi:hypothetical protein EIN_296470 [Entamoeba invadens IP1]|uniref:Tetratricopeptide repeat protein n=2 Tax=Entamoeba invadens TaxID=33085 RepID=L7FL55_ENTIV|nr:hypothetical protein EIN_296470 [Entamoeba invadens IP1]ELP86337.1 hypothetical protein EIN_296470 [Entamoeba invadens IP1]BAN41088.1 hypothetical protein [Entamoeba invadens]|eukprot:XP_004185683.1 hypothetical protein EIN_296470 [Entamoeba invadens IP1]
MADVEDIICDAQDAFFEGKYEEAISLCLKALEEGNDDDVYELLVLSHFERNDYTSAFESAERWYKVAKRLNKVRARLALLRSSYLIDNKQSFETVAVEMLGINESKSEVACLYLDMFPEKSNYILNLLAKDTDEFCGAIVRRLEGKIAVSEEDVELRQCGNEAYSIGVIANTALLSKCVIPEEDIERIKVWEKLGAELPYVRDSVTFLRHLPLEKQRGVHFIFRKHCKPQ